MGFMGIAHLCENSLGIFALPNSIRLWSSFTGGASEAESKMWSPCGAPRSTSVAWLECLYPSHSSDVLGFSTKGFLQPSHLKYPPLHIFYPVARLPSEKLSGVLACPNLASIPRLSIGFILSDSWECNHLWRNEIYRGQEDMVTSPGWVPTQQDWCLCKTGEIWTEYKMETRATPPHQVRNHDGSWEEEGLPSRWSTKALILDIQHPELWGDEFLLFNPLGFVTVSPES